ncbi:MAG: hypothetical protein ACW967_05950 [Candidatus Hodarchaeales archaeon]|jgi:hypothetical protein
MTDNSNNEDESDEKPNKSTNSQVVKDSEVRTIIGGKLLDYKKRLKSKPLSLFSIDESELHREEVDILYNSIEEMPTRLLDGRLYNFFILMQKKRDLQFLQEKSTPIERINRLGRFMLRLSTPILFLNHNHNVQINYPSKIDHSDINQKKIVNRNDFIQSGEVINPIMSQEELFQAKESLKEKLTSRKDWIQSELNEVLDHNEADLLSQMLSSEDELIMFVNHELINFFTDKNEKKLKKKLKSHVFTLEPKK